MTTIEAIRAVLVADVPVNGIVSERVYPQVMPQGAALPAIVLTVVSDVPENTFDGTAADRLSARRLQVDCYAKSYLAAQNLAAAVDQALSSLQAHDLSAERDNARDLYDDPTEIYRVSMDFTVWR